MARITVTRFRYRERAAAKMWRHGVAIRQLDDILANRHVIVRNRSQRAAPYVLIGRDDQGRCLTIPIVPTEDPFIWRPVTAWPCKPSEAAKLR